MATITRKPRALIRGALRLIGVGGQGEDLEAEQENDAFEIFNEMLASWTEVQHVVFIESFTVLTVEDSFAIGSGATFDTDRPINIHGGYIRNGAQDTPLSPMSRQAYDRISSKSSSATPERFYYRPTYPNGTIYFDARLSIGDVVYLELLKPIGSVSTLDTDLVLPPEFALAIRFNLAVLLAPEYEKIPSPVVLAKAAESYDTLIRLATALDMVESRFDSVLTGGNQTSSALYGSGGSLTVLDGDGDEHVI